MGKIISKKGSQFLSQKVVPTVNCTPSKHFVGLTSGPMWPGTSHTDSSVCCPRCCSGASKLRRKKQNTQIEMDLIQTDCKLNNDTQTYLKGLSLTRRHTWVSGPAEGLPLPDVKDWTAVSYHIRVMSIEFRSIGWRVTELTEGLSLTSSSCSIWKTFFSSWGGAVSSWVCETQRRF